MTTWTPDWTPMSWRFPRRWCLSTWRWPRPTSWTSGAWWTSASWGRPWGWAGSCPAGRSSPILLSMITGRSSGISARARLSCSPNNRRIISERKSRDGMEGERWGFPVTKFWNSENILQFEIQPKLEKKYFCAENLILAISRFFKMFQSYLLISVVKLSLV